MSRITLLFAILFSLCTCSTLYGECVITKSDNWADIKNGTPYKVTFMYRWEGCGAADNGYLRKHHKRKVHAQKGHAVNLGKGNFWVGSATLTPFNLSTGKEMVALRLPIYDYDDYKKTLMYDPKKVGNDVVDGFYWVDK